jgi:hypothetical protein
VERALLPAAFDVDFKAKQIAEKLGFVSGHGVHQSISFHIRAIAFCIRASL